MTVVILLHNTSQIQYQNVFIFTFNLDSIAIHDLVLLRSELIHFLNSHHSDSIICRIERLQELFLTN